MMVVAIFTLTAAAILALGVAASGAGQDRWQRRLALARGLPALPRAREQRRRVQLRQRVRHRLGEGPSTWTEQLRQALARAGLRVRPQVFVACVALCGFVVGALCWLLGLGAVPSLLIGAAGAALGGRAVLATFQRRYRQAFVDELPNALDAIVRGVKAGLPLQETARLVAREASEPLRSEFRRMLDQVALGQSLADAADALATRVPSPDVKFFAVVLNVQAQAGGNLSEALGNLSAVLRSRKRMANRITALSAEARTSALIIGCLPFAIGIIVSVTTPSYMAPLITTSWGQMCVGLAALLMGIGILVMRRMIRFEV